MKLCFTSEWAGQPRKDGYLASAGHSVLYKDERSPSNSALRRRLTRFIMIWKSQCHIVSYHVCTVNMIYFFRMCTWLKTRIGWKKDTVVWKTWLKSLKKSDPPPAQTGIHIYSETCMVIKWYELKYLKYTSFTSFISLKYNKQQYCVIYTMQYNFNFFDDSATFHNVFKLNSSSGNKIIKYIRPLSGHPERLPHMLWF